MNPTQKTISLILTQTLTLSVARTHGNMQKYENIKCSDLGGKIIPQADN